jgi:hypothetical protein
MQAQKTKHWQYDWRKGKGVGKRPTSENAQLFHEYVHWAYEAIAVFQHAAFPYSELERVCQPQYLFQVVSDMCSDKLSMRIFRNEEGLKLVVIHSVG